MYLFKKDVTGFKAVGIIKRNEAQVRWFVAREDKGGRGYEKEFDYYVVLDIFDRVIIPISIMGKRG